MHSERHAIVGVAESDRSRNSGKSTLRLAVEAGRRAIADAGLAPADVDGILSYHDLDSSDSHTVATYLGIKPRFFDDSFGGGSATETLVAKATALIDAGLANNVLIFRSLNGRSGGRMGGSLGASDWNPQAVMAKIFSGSSFLAPFGAVTPAEYFGLVASRHMHDRGLTSEHLEAVCMAFYEHAQRNPKAIFYGRPLSHESYRDAPYICWPLRLPDYCTETDEANAIIVSSAERARDARHTPVYIRGMAGRHGTDNAHIYATADPTHFAAQLAAKEVYRTAGLGPADIDVAAIYDCFSWVVLAQIEAYGLAPDGDVGAFVSAGNLRLGGKLPTNTAGGMLAEGYTHGMNNLIELVRQLRHEYVGSDRQVQDCKVGLCTGWGGPRSSSALILSR